MPRRPSIAILIIVAGAFFLIGLYTAFLGGGSPAGSSPTTVPLQTATIPVPADIQPRTLLILGTDQLMGDESSLKAVWFVSSNPPLPDVFLLGVSPARVVDGDPPQALSDHFRLESNGAPSSDFLETLYRAVPLDINVVAVLDATAFSTAIDFVGGVTINNTTFSGDEVLGILSLSQDDPEADILLQRRLLEAMATGADALSESPELTALVELQPDHLYLSQELIQMLEFMAPLLPIRAETTHIEVY